MRRAHQYRPEWSILLQNILDKDKEKFTIVLVFHDDTKSYELKNNQWIVDEEKWS